MDGAPKRAMSWTGIEPGGNEHPLITVHAAARALGYSDMTIRRKIEARQFPAVKMGSKALVPRAFVEQLIADALAGQTVIVEEYAAAWSQNRGDQGSASQNAHADSDSSAWAGRGDVA